jgi:hypothetical protein
MVGFLEVIADCDPEVDVILLIEPTPHGTVAIEEAGEWDDEPEGVLAARLAALQPA